MESEIERSESELKNLETEYEALLSAIDDSRATYESGVRELMS